LPKACIPDCYSSDVSAARPVKKYTALADDLEGTVEAAMKASMETAVEAAIERAVE